CGDKGGHGPPLPDQKANRNRTRKAGVSMSDPTAASKGGRARGKTPYHLAPWLAMGAMAAATLWRQVSRKPQPHPAAPRAPTPAELDRAEPGRGRCAAW